jgi:hypothetical protein
MEELTSGRMRVPNFQRGFVWDPERVSYLMDSIYKGYPFGSVLLWRTRESLSSERQLGPFDLPSNDPSYPTDYILDGQQRITSIFGVFQTDIVIDNPPLWTKVYFDLEAPANVQDSAVVALEDAEVDRERYFPLGCLFDPAAFRKETARYPADGAVMKRIDLIQTRFKEADIPVQMITTEDKTAVAIVFERVNQRGVELDTVQLLSAWTWSGDFDLNQKFEDLAADLAPFGFRDVGADKDLLLRCCSAVLTGDPSHEALVKLNGSTVRTGFDTVITGIKGAIDFLRKNVHLQTLTNLPYDNLLVPLSVFFAGQPNTQHKMTDSDRREMLKWFWKTCFTRRYNSQPIKSLREDVAEMTALKEGRASKLSDLPFSVNSRIFLENGFRINSVLSKSFVLMLAQAEPRSFISGQKLDLGACLKEYNRNEFHHIYPRSFLRSSEQTEPGDTCLANMCFLSKTDNNMLGGAAPSIYREKMPADISEISANNFLPSNTFVDEYTNFASARADLLFAYATSITA